MHDLLNNPAVSSMVILLTLAIGGFLIKVLSHWSSALDNLHVQGQATAARVEAVAVTAIKTETLVNSQASERKAENERLKAVIDGLQAKMDTMQAASTLAATVAAETAARIAIQTAKDLAVLPAAPVHATPEVPLPVAIVAETPVPVQMIPHPEEPPAPR